MGKILYSGPALDRDDNSAQGILSIGPWYINLWYNTCLGQAALAKGEFS
jgi:hypothetical protein